MTDTPAPPKRRRRTAETVAALRRLAKEAAENGEPLRQISRRLDIPWSSLTDWARADGFRRQDIAARRAAAARAQDEADRIRRQAEAAARRTVLRDRDGDAPDDPFAAPSQVEADIMLARARVGALLEAGYIPEAEEDMRAARRLTRLAGFAAPVRAATEAASRQMQREASNAVLHRLALQVCACWQEGDEPPEHLPWVVSATFQKRLAICRLIMQAYYPDDDFDPRETTADLFRLAKVGWFREFQEVLRTAIRRFERQDKPDLADRIRKFQEEDQAALPDLIAWAEENGYGYWGEP